VILSHTQVAILAELWRREQAQEAAPTVRELMAVAGLRSTGTVWQALSGLRDARLVVGSGRHVRGVWGGMTAEHWRLMGIPGPTRCPMCGSLRPSETPL